MSCPIKVNSNTIELTVHTSCYCVLDLLCVRHLNTFYVAFYLINFSDLSSSVVYFDQLFLCWVIVYSDQLLGAHHTLLYLITIQYSDPHCIYCYSTWARRNEFEPGIPVKKEGAPPASISSTEVEASSESRLARTDPAEPPPTEKKTRTVPVWTCITKLQNYYLWKIVLSKLKCNSVVVTLQPDLKTVER